MWHGATVRLHPGTVCHLSAPGRDFDDEQCAIKKYDAAKGKWHVELQRDKFKGKELIVPESSLRLSFCLLPESLRLAKRHVKLVDDDQDACGRGLAVAETVAPGTPLFEEPPFVVTRTGPNRSHEDRWRAYVTLMLNRPNGGEAALAAFDDLGICDKINESVREAAHAILEQAIRASGGGAMPDAQKREHVRKVCDALMRFQSNQFKYDNRAPDGCARFSASCVFHLTSRLNHSCEPSAFVEVHAASTTTGEATSTAVPFS